MVNKYQWDGGQKSHKLDCNSAQHMTSTTHTQPIMRIEMSNVIAKVGIKFRGPRLMNMHNIHVHI